MILLVEEAARFQDFIISNGWEFYFIGGIAVQIWGEPRLTKDIDLTVFTNLANEPAFIQKIISKYKPKFADAPQFALMERILPVLTETGVTIDISLSGFSDMSESLPRASYQPFFGDISLKICSANDLIIMKTLAGRPRDWPDIESVIIKQRYLEWDYIEGSIRNLFEYGDDLATNLSHLNELRTKYYKP